MNYQHFNWGPFIMKTSCPKRVLKRLDADGRQAKTNWNHELAGHLKNQYRYPEVFDQWFYTEMSEVFTGYRQAHCVYHGFEYIATEDDDAIDEIIELEPNFKSSLVEMVKASIKLQTYEKELTLGLRSFAFDGVDQIRKLLIELSHLLEKQDKIHFEIFSIGAPKYRIWFAGQFYEDLDNISEDVKRYIEKYVEDMDDLEYNIIEQKA